MDKRLLFLVTVFFSTLLCAQKFEVSSGSLEALTNVRRYKVLFEYDTNLIVHNHDSEEAFLNFKSSKLDKKTPGNGAEFKKLWFENRVNQYEPTFIQEFNSFNIDRNQVTVAKNINSADYTMVVKTNAIATGYNDLLYVEAGFIEVEIRIFSSENPESIIYSASTTVRGEAISKEFERIRTAYGNLGLALSKRLNRKVLEKK